jgi:deoxyribose-phosphate aldolase
MKTANPATVAKIISLIDLTSLSQGDTESSILSLCEQARTPYGCPAAVCIFPKFIGVAHTGLSERGLRERVRIATVTNFPEGGAKSLAAVEQTKDAIAAGADEIDVVFPWRALLLGETAIGYEMIAACKRACGDQTLKVIIESGELQDPILIRKASQIAIEAGADFLKTSTGKVPVNATPEAARVMLQVIAEENRNCGFKAAGGVRSLQDAQVYLEIATELLGEDWVTPEHLRFGASGLLATLVAAPGAATHSIY